METPSPLDTLESFICNALKRARYGSPLEHQAEEALLAIGELRAQLLPNLPAASTAVQ
jgi:hypothetical protein